MVVNRVGVVNELRLSHD